MTAIIGAVPRPHLWKRICDDLEDAAADAYGNLERVPLLRFLSDYPVPSYTYRISDVMSRGERPGPQKLIDLCRHQGFQATVNLCAEMTAGDALIIGKAGLAGELRTYHIPIVDMEAPKLAQVLELLDLLTGPGAPLTYVHCEAGKCRTGVMTACYRMAVMGWTAIDAVTEARNFGCVIPGQLAFIRMFGARLAEGHEARAAGRSRPGTSWAGIRSSRPDRCGPPRRSWPLSSPRSPGRKRASPNRARRRTGTATAPLNRDRGEPRPPIARFGLVHIRSPESSTSVCSCTPGGQGPGKHERGEEHPMNEPQPLAPPSPVAGLNAQIGLIGQRQEQLAHVVAELGGSVSDFDQLRTYVEQIASILANLAKEVGAHDLDGVERRLDEMGRVTLEIETLRQETREIAAIVGGLVQRANAPVPWWPDLAAGPEREAAVQNLGRWVDEVLRARHPEAYNELGTCWFQHPDILDELTALRAAWFAAYRDPDASPMAAIEWHDHWLPGTMARCKAIIRGRGCKARHQKQLDSTVSFLDRSEFTNFAKCAPDAVPPATESAPPWGPAVEPEPAQGPAAEPGRPRAWPRSLGRPRAWPRSPGRPRARSGARAGLAPGRGARAGPRARPRSPGRQGPAGGVRAGQGPAAESGPAQGPAAEPASGWSPTAEPGQSWEPITEPIQSWGRAEDPPPPPPPPPPSLPPPLVEPGEE